MKQNTNTIVLTGGGSGGHITPLLSVARELKRRDKQCQIVYIGLKGEKIEGLQSHYEAFDRVCVVPAGKFRRYHGESFLAHLVDVKTLVLNVRDAFRVIRGIFASRRLLGSLRPSVVFSKGGFVAVPVGIAAHQLKIPIITHDSDVVPGLANRIIGRWAVVHATGMPAEYYVYPPETTAYTGIPVSEKHRPVSKPDQASFKREQGLSQPAPVITVAGGGLGSQSVNRLVINTSAKLLEQIPDLHIFHFCGSANVEETASGYQKALGSLAKQVTIKGFTDELYKYTGAADVVVARAGATTLAELAVQAKPAVIIPSPFLTGGHQLKNAEILANQKAAVVISEEKAEAELGGALVGLLADSAERARLAASMAKLARPEAARQLAGLILEYSKSGQGSH